MITLVCLFLLGVQTTYLKKKFISKHTKNTLKIKDELLTASPAKI